MAPCSQNLPVFICGQQTDLNPVPGFRQQILLKPLPPPIPVKKLMPALPTHPFMQHKTTSIHSSRTVLVMKPRIAPQLDGTFDLEEEFGPDARYVQLSPKRRKLDFGNMSMQRNLSMQVDQAKKVAQARMTQKTNLQYTLRFEFQVCLHIFPLSII
ncbi:hypothetical protein Ciccas_010802 [Cichlidogyrus casuarinus]|uniref:Uncharacterized protein n=1 Tax=Cichlidogyrus casuarinus TaxID=1844966 RepID=A0ABD2PVZ6_9PLAT